MKVVLLNGDDLANWTRFYTVGEILPNGRRVEDDYLPRIPRYLIKAGYFMEII